MTFKNALCMSSIPERDWAGLSVRHACCQRRWGHKGAHRSWSREWRDEDRKSKQREEIR
jgi:hypothetical protein